MFLNSNFQVLEKAPHARMEAEKKKIVDVGRHFA
jgi:hypothetical protein